ncbi:pilus assembly protein [Sphingomonas gei]|uniref:Pilus assembly protein n=2 Tax=Sphingomonas gei TaxID=1395960 RepID=A0A4S1XJN7_9SPHN|nr:pilus assembly protein [Sphingomonas gei]
MARHVLSFRDDTRGVAAIEFAFIAAPLAGLMVAILQTSLTFFAQQTLETTAEKSVRKLITGEAQKASMTAAQFKTLVCTKLPSFMKCDNVYVDVTSAVSFASIATSAPTITFDGDGKVTNSFAFTPGGPGSINIVRIMYAWDVQAGPFGFDLATMSNKKRLLYATAVFKTEPYT